MPHVEQEMLTRPEHLRTHLGFVKVHDVFRFCGALFFSFVVLSRLLIFDCILDVDCVVLTCVFTSIYILL